MATQKLNLTRDQLASFLKNFEQIKQFEQLFAVVDAIAPSSDTPGIELLAGNADSNANQALSQIVSLSRDSAINSGNADQKATQALDTLNRIANTLDLLATSPAIQHNNATDTDYIDFNVGAPFVSQVARVGWNSTDATLDLNMEYGVTQQIGQ